MITQLDLGRMITEFIRGEVQKRLEPQQKQLAEVIRQVQDKVGKQPPPAKVTIGAPKSPELTRAEANGKKKTGRRPGVPYGIPEEDWPEVVKRRDAGESGASIAKGYHVTPATVYNTYNRAKRARKKAR